MAKVTAKSGLAGKVGQAGAKAVATHREDETEFDSGGRLPDGIENGVAQLIDCRFGQYEKGDNVGEYFFYAAGTVVEPKSVNGVPIAGLRTSIIEPVHETEGRKRESVEDHIAWVLNEMRKLGADTKDVTIEDLETLAAALKEEAPMFRFRTWKGTATKQYPNPRVNEVWNGSVDYTGDVTDGAVADNSEEADSKEPAESTEEEVDLEALGKAADGKNKAKATEAQTKLSELCEEHGVNPEEYEGWAEVAAVLTEAMGTGEEAAAEGEAEAEGTEEVVPAVGEVWFYKPPKGKKIEVEVTAIFATKKAANVKNLEDGKTSYKSVPFAQLMDS